MKNIEHYKHIVKDHNLLIFGNNELTQHQDILNYFQSLHYLQSTQYNLENFTVTLLEFSIDTVIITDTEFLESLSVLLQELQLNKELKLMLCLYPPFDTYSENMINISDSIFTSNIPKEQLSKKIFNLLNGQLTTHYIDKTPHTEERYKDQFDYEIMALSDELKQIVKSLDSGDISPELLKKLALHITMVSNIFKQYLITSKTIESLIYNFDNYLQNFDLKSISIDSIDGFEHLARLVDDIAIFLDKYFLSKEIGDIYVVEDSLKNSFEYVKMVFSGKQNSKNDDDGSELEFF